MCESWDKNCDMTAAVFERITYVFAVGSMAVLKFLDDNAQGFLVLVSIATFCGTMYYKRMDTKIKRMEAEAIIHGAERRKQIEGGD